MEKLDFLRIFEYSKRKECRKYVGLITIWDILKQNNICSNFILFEFNNNMGYIETRTHI